MIQDSTTTTTSSQGMPQKYRGYSLKILEVLSSSGGLTTGEIAMKTGIDVFEVYKACRRMYGRGAIDKKERWGWQILPYGNLIIAVSTTTTTAVRMNIPQTYHEHTMNIPSNSRQIDLRSFTAREDMDEPERVVVEALVAHYERTGVKYRLFTDPFEFATELDMAIQDVMPALRKLKEEGCVYFLRDPLGWKVGLKKDFVERMQHV